MNVSHKFLEKDIFLSNCFEREVYKLLEFPDDFVGFDKVLFLNNAFLWGRVEHEQNSVVKKFVNEKFTLVDSNLQLCLVTSETWKNEKIRKYSNKLGFTRVGQVKDLKKLTDIAMESLTYSRFNFDPEIKSSQIRNMRSHWILNSIKNLDARKSIIICNERELIIGFAVYSIKKHNLFIELVAIDKNYRGLGLFRMTLFDLIRLYNENISHIFIGTQPYNYLALNSYYALGFRAVKFSYTFHRHL